MITESHVDSPSLPLVDLDIGASYFIEDKDGNRVPLNVISAEPTDTVSVSTLTEELAALMQICLSPFLLMSF